MIRRLTCGVLVALVLAAPAIARPQRFLDGVQGIKWGMSRSEAERIARSRWRFKSYGQDGSANFVGTIAGYNAEINVLNPVTGILAQIFSQQGKASAEIFADVCYLLREKYGDYELHYRPAITESSEVWAHWDEDVDLEQNDSNWNAVVSGTYDARAEWDFDNGASLFLFNLGYDNGNRSVWLFWRHDNLHQRALQSKQRQRIETL